MYVYGNGLVSQNSSSEGYLNFHYNNIGSTIVLTNEEGAAEESYTYGPYGEILSGDTSKTAYLYNGMYGVSTDANGLYYMRARYYNVSIKRFINQDIMNGSITNSQSLNKFSYVQGNPISLTDPFGLSPDISISGMGHAALDLLGVIPGFDVCDGVNAAWYLKEGDYENAALSAVACIPMLGSVVGNGFKWGAKGVANAEKVADTIKLGSRMVGDGGSMLLSGGQAVESAKQVYTNITNGDGLTWKNAVDVITLGISVAGMGMAGASIAKSGKTLKAMYKGEKAVSNVATSNATKSISQTRENGGSMKMDLQMFASKSDSKVYYHVTTAENAKKIIESGELKNGKWESYVFAWTQQPTKKQASIAGISSEAQTVIKFKTNASFVLDTGNKEKSISNIVVQTTEGQRLPISISDVEIVGFKKEWWQFWKK